MRVKKQVETRVDEEEKGEGEEKKSRFKIKKLFRGLRRRPKVVGVGCKEES